VHRSGIDYLGKESEFIEADAKQPGRCGVGVWARKKNPVSKGEQRTEVAYLLL
jgi:hypothetical protein